MDYNTEERKHRIQILQKASGGRAHNRRARILANLMLVALGMLIMLLFGMVFRACTDAQPDAYTTDCRQCHSRVKTFTDYFRKMGSKAPEAMAEAVVATKNPRLMAAIAKVETQGNPQVRRTGYKKQHDGAWQVNRKAWGRVPLDVTEQALQAELVLKTHVEEEKDFIKGLNAYGGESNKRHGRYAKLILSELTEVPQ